MQSWPGWRRRRWSKTRPSPTSIRESLAERRSPRRSLVALSVEQSEGLFVGPVDLPAIRVSAYVCDIDAIILGLQPREGSVGESAFSYGQIASYTVDVDHLAIGESGTEKILSVLDAIAAEASGLIPLYRAGIEISTHPGTTAGPPA